MSQGLSAYCCVTTMILHMTKETANCYRGTPFENDWYIYHDALSLMTARETVNWMQQEDLLKRWILPLNGLNDEASLKLYAKRPPGDSPYFMPWDNSLNQDLHLAVDYHAVMTSDLDEGELKKFSLSTPSRGSSAYRRILHPLTGGIPSSARICRDVDKVFESMKVVLDNGGIKVDGLGNRKGRRHKASENDNRGGHCPRKRAMDDYGAKWMHEDARGCERLGE